jgi:D-3-phosphoglycerate dehydrogenase
MPGPKVHIFQPVDEKGDSHQRLRKAGVDLKLAEMTWMDMANLTSSWDQEFDADTAAAAGVSSRTVHIPRKSLESVRDMRLLAFYTVGFDNVDLDAATGKGILVVHSPTETNWGGVAEGTVANILAILKKVREKDRHVKAGGWRERKLQGHYLGARQIDDFPGLTLGIVGLGRIGGRVADLLDPWRMRMIGCDPYVDDSLFVHHNVKRVDLETLLAESDIVTLHCNLTAETRNLIGAKQLALMKKTAILCNHARGPIVDVDALASALESDTIAAAALDVLPEEPPAKDHPILALGDKVLLSPHMISNNVGTGLTVAVPWVEKAILDALQGQVPRHVVNPEALPAWTAKYGGKSLL